jgi:ABC-type Mn2+/Zn2+ transport system permease subunit
MFFTLLSASTVAALQTVGAFLVIAMVVTPARPPTCSPTASPA